MSNLVEDYKGCFKEYALQYEELLRFVSRDPAYNVQTDSFGIQVCCPNRETLSFSLYLCWMQAVALSFGISQPNKKRNLIKTNLSSHCSHAFWVELVFIFFLSVDCVQSIEEAHPLYDLFATLLTIRYVVPSAHSQGSALAIVIRLCS